jgi:surface polysaccharide O-acyltransferase-like enzyme
MNERRYDLDWLRIIAFGVLILYHVGMFYVTWDWHVKSSRASAAIVPLMSLFNPWRLALLFLISGAATRFMADKMSAAELTGSRMRRLGPPLLLAVFVIVPPQIYYEVVEAIAKMPDPTSLPQRLWLENFYLKYITASGNWCDKDGCLITPTYTHVWFVAYLIVYTLVLIPLLPALRRLPNSASILIKGPGLIITPWIFMFLLRATLFPIFGETLCIWNDWYLHAHYFAIFLFGFSVAKYSPFFERCARLRWLSFGIAIGAWTIQGIVYFDVAWAAGTIPTALLRTAFHGMRELQGWTAIVAAIGFAHHYLRNVSGPILRLLTQAIFPFYLIHQTIIVVTAHYLDKLKLPLTIEVLLLVGSTLIGCWLFFDLGRRVPALRVWIGLSPRIAMPNKSMQLKCEEARG